MLCCLLLFYVCVHRDPLQSFKKNLPMTVMGFARAAVAEDLTKSVLKRTKEAVAARGAALAKGKVKWWKPLLQKIIFLPVFLVIFSTCIDYTLDQLMRLSLKHTTSALLQGEFGAFLTWMMVGPLAALGLLDGGGTNCDAFRNMGRSDSRIKLLYFRVPELSKLPYWLLQLARRPVFAPPSCSFDFRRRHRHEALGETSNRTGGSLPFYNASQCQKLDDSGRSSRFAGIFLVYGQPYPVRSERCNTRWQRNLPRNTK